MNTNSLNWPRLALVWLGWAALTGRMPVHAESSVTHHAAPVQAYATLPAAKGARLSPNGQYMAAIEPIKGRNAIIIRSVSSKATPVALALGAGEPQWVIWKSDRRLVASLRLINESGRLLKLVDTRLISFDRDGSKLVKLIASETGDFTPQIQDKVISELPNDPEHVLVELPRIDRFSRAEISNAEMHARYEHPEVHRVNVHTGETTRVVGQHGIINHWLADRDGTVRLGWAYQRDKSVQLMMRDNEQTPWRVIQSLDLNAGQTFTPLDFLDPAGQRLLVESNHEDGFEAIYEFDTIKRNYVRKVSGANDGPTAGLVRHGRLLGYEQARQRSPNYMDPLWAADVATAQRALPDAHIAVVDRSNTGQQVLLSVTRGIEPSDYWLLSRTSSQTELAPLTTSYPALVPEQFAGSQWVKLKARDGQIIPALLTLPSHIKSGRPEAPLPFIVLPHGGPSSHDKQGFNYQVQFLASRGYGVLQPQFRGSTGYGQKFLAAGYRQWGLAMQDDVTDASKWLIEQKLADPTRIALVGGSYGGYAALMGLVKEPNLYRCAVALAPVTDLPTLVDDRQAYIFGDLNIPQIGTDTRQLEATSPSYQASRITKPVLLMHGRKDYTVPALHTELMEASLKKAGRSPQVIYLPEADHFLSRTEDREAYLTALEAFLSKHLSLADASIK